MKEPFHDLMQRAEQTRAGGDEFTRLSADFALALSTGQLTILEAKRIKRVFNRKVREEKEKLAAEKKLNAMKKNTR